MANIKGTVYFYFYFEFFQNSKLDGPLNFGFGHKILYVDRQRISEYDPWKFAPNPPHIIGYINELVLFSYDSPPSDARGAPNYIRTPIFSMTHMKIGTLRSSKMQNTPYAIFQFRVPLRLHYLYVNWIFLIWLETKSKWRYRSKTIP